MQSSRACHGARAIRLWARCIASVFGGLAAVAIDSTPARGQRPAPDSTGFVTVEGRTRLYFEIHGDSRDTVLVPGGVMLAPHLALLGERFTVVYYDPRGRGRSDWVGENKRLSIEAEVRDLEAVRSALAIGRAALVGFSYLGLVSAIYAADHPQRVSRLVLMGPMPPDHETASRYAPAERRARSASASARFAQSRAGADTNDFAAECRRWYEAFGPLYVGDPADAARITTEFCVHENETPARLLWHNEQINRSLGRRWDYSRKAAAIRAPTLVIQGDRDLAASPDGGRRWAELIPEARLIMLAGAGHMTHLERADRVLLALQRFLSGQWPGEAMRVRSRQ
ncbi:MAG TPA: alpha/beta hydrolase [Gemmatimonadaceae bacterium]|nr:alpha/beta hydrolase [Gemmatimonadaceae bacterium]